MDKGKNELILIPKSEKYIQYMVEAIFKLPRTEKFNIGNEYKISMYKMLKQILMISKVEERDKLYYINYVDAELNTQRIFLRIMYKNKWISEQIFRIASDMIYELGKIIGGLLKYYGKNYKKCV